ncbi:MAG TPA: PQQ-dependent sugar dehydrogenase [Kiritimatiellia bacterium]|nr:PQQ-dependent sugar dehydrogenase [Kiritimatiellia bacterium]HMO97505.1 PQQ-dependent sugar dehydrogenase [Kiritimatiellia bacterium]HMP97152.1 PQQ-dependent sugar dehydrogenase [Kiritimatiellia bacterium]
MKILQRNATPLAWCVAAGWMALISEAHAVIITNASDSGSAPVYASSWPNGSNGGFGFGSWNLNTSGDPANGGFFMGEGAGNLNIGPRAWGLYANNGQTTWAERTFNEPLVVGSVFRVRFDNNWIEDNGITAVHLSNSDQQHLWFLEFIGGESSYRMSDQVTDMGWTDQGLDITFTLTSATEYEVTVVRAGTTTHTYTGTLVSRANMTIDRTRFWNISAGTGGEYNFYFNDLEITTPDLNTITTAPDAIVMPRLSKAGIDVLRNDVGSIDPSTLIVVTPPAHGTAAPMPDGRILYQHTSGLPAQDAFTYRVSTPGGSNSAPETVTVTFSSDARIPNTTVTVPLEPPPTSFSVADAFPGITFSAPTAMASPPGETNRIFVAQRNGRIYVITGVGGPNPQKVLFMDISGRIYNDGNELGLKGINFHPDYAQNGYFYVSYCHRTGGQDFVRLSRFSVQGGNPNAGNANSELMLINHRNLLNVHNINNIVFGPDGYLYLGMGDEGFTGPGPDGRNNSQRIDSNMWSAILRIDVDKKPESLAPNSHPGIPLDGGNARYAIPADNPFVGATSFNGLSVNPNNVRTEFFAVGLRNPWQFSFDELTGEMWVADVGNSAREEVTIMPPGSNGGWVFFEGTAPGPRPDRVPPPGFTYERPVWEYTHGFGEFQGLSVIGGFVYRGTTYSSLYGKYLCADYVSGNIWTIERTAGATNVTRITGEGGLIAFGINPANGDIIMLDHGDGVVRKLIATPSQGANFPETLSATGFFADLADLSPNPGIIGYEPNLSFWSDYGIKSRWFVITNTTDRIGMSRDGNWTYPDGMMWVKHFDIEMERGNPDTKKRLETRVLVKNPGGAYGVSYQWNEEETQAILVPDAGVNFELTITNNEQQVVQDWRIPSRAECMICHNPDGGHALSFNTRQLNCPGTIGNASGNFITMLENAGYTSNSLGNPAQLARYVRPDEEEYSLEVRARSYLAVNCSYCHMGPDSPVPGMFDSRSFVKLHDTAMLLGSAASNGGNTNNLLLVPNDTAHSIIWNRIGASNNFSRMPPIGSTEIDHVSVKLLADWINGELSGRQSFAQWQADRFGDVNDPNAAPDADPDGDGRTNYEEFLTYTNPNDAFEYWSAELVEADGQHYLTHDLAHRAVWVETSTSLVEAAWAHWNISENNGLPIGPGAVRFLPVSGDVTNLFFRFKLEEL